MRCSIPSLLLAVVGLLIGGSTPLLGSSPPIAVSSSVESADLLESTLRVLRDRIPDLRFNREQLESVRGRFAAAGSRAERREVVRRFLDRIPTSHLALFSSYAKFTFERELAGELSTTLGLTLIESGGTYYVSSVLRGTPASEAGIVRGDRVISIDGDSPALSPRLDARHDDSAPPDEASHLVRVRWGDRVPIVIARGGAGPRTTLEMTLPAVRASSLRSDQLGVRLETRRGVQVGVIPLSYVYSRATSRHVSDALRGPLARADAIVLDLRGRGGSGIALLSLTRLLMNPIALGDRPLVAAIDRRTRSAKEVLAQSMRRRQLGTLVGEKTPGAVRGSQWVELGSGEWLLCPHGPIGVDPRGLEGIGVAPDLWVDDPFPNGDGADPILSAAIDEAARQVLDGASRTTTGRGSRPPR